jgi:DNA-binding NarL/FixJ family response regulator
MSVGTHTDPAGVQARFTDLTKEDPMISAAPELATTAHTERTTTPRTRSRVLVVDDHPAVRAGLCDLLGDQVDFDVVAAAASAEEALRVAERVRIDVAVVDYQLGGRNGLWVSRKLKRLPAPPRVVMYSAYADDILAAAAVVAEADGIVSKGRLGSALCEAVRAVLDGRSRLQAVPPWLSEAIQRRLDPQEQAIFALLLAGIEPDEIAERLGLSAAGLDSRLWAMLRRLEGR